MLEPDRHPSISEVTCDDACAVLETVLAGPARGEMLDWALERRSFGTAVKRLRSSMKTHVLRPAAGPLSLRDMIFQLDNRTREEGLHVFHAWEFADHRFSKDNLPTLMLDHCSSFGPAVLKTRASLAILLDYYFLHVLALCAVRAWDGGDAIATLDRVTRLVGHLQGPWGSGQRFVENAETLLVLAVSHYHPEEQGYEGLIERVQGLTEAHQLRFTLIASAVLGSHLRWGLALMYKRDLGRLREDNVADYPWLLFCLVTLMREYARLNEAGIDGAVRENVVDGLLNGLTPDPWAFVDEAPPALADHTAERAELYGLLSRYRTVQDGFSRYLLACQGLSGTTYAGSRRVFTRLFREFGLPERMRTDNGTPFASMALGRLSRLSVWWIKLGILPDLIEPASPQQNGRHERMHRDLKAETTIPPAANGAAQQRRFNTWRAEFNEIRPHEALGQEPPASVYVPSNRPFPSKLQTPEYPAHFEIRKVSTNGGIRWHSDWVNVSHLLGREHIGLEQIDNDIWAVYFGPVSLGWLHVREAAILDHDGHSSRNPRR